MDTTERRLTHRIAGLAIAFIIGAAIWVGLLLATWPTLAIIAVVLWAVWVRMVWGNR